MIETSSVGSGLYSTFRPQKHGFTATISGLLNLDDPTALTLYDLRQKQLALTQVLVKFTRTDAAGNEYISTFDAYITGSTDSGDANGAASFDIDLQGTGELVESSSSVVKICNQTWMTRNWDGTTFRNGDTIPEVTDDSTWASLTTPAWCYYDNDPANGAIYGKMYNWYAVNDPRGLAPFGWRVPIEDDINDLLSCLGSLSVVGGKMKQTGTTLWTAPNTGATNESGFTALPSGSRDISVGAFSNIGINSSFWYNETYFTNAKAFSVTYNSSALTPVFGLPYGVGISVRLIKDI
jgi:uncharacterized protein (TIGR02145 family)